MKFLANISKTENHLTTITEKLKVHDQAFFAVAFLKTSGLYNLSKPIKDFLISGGQLIIIAGQNLHLQSQKHYTNFVTFLNHFRHQNYFLQKQMQQQMCFIQNCIFSNHKRTAV